MPSLLRFTSTVLRFCPWRVKHTFIWLSADKQKPNYPLFTNVNYSSLFLSVEVCLKDTMSVADSMYNLQLIREFCESHLTSCCPLQLEDLLYAPPTLQVRYALPTLQVNCALPIFKCEICPTHFAGALCPAHFTGKLCHTHFAGKLCPAHFTGERCPTHFRSQIDMQHSVYFES